ncbi:MAG: hypothetical protein R3E55_15310 [Burkholderiaceae bacterium]|nr:hypothetical protein [Burkholderiaceae bacterium]MCO5112087.1 hypothetical protein [Burkholderiaceae bacterium]
MQSTTVLASIALLAAAISTPLFAGDREHGQRRDRQLVTQKHAPQGFDQGMQTVVHAAAADAPGHGWRYFSDPSTLRAVVISPQGDYYYSRGKGLRWIAAEQS